MSKKNYYKLPLVVLLLSALIATFVLVVPVDEDSVTIGKKERNLSIKLHSAYSKDEGLYGVASTVNAQQRFDDNVYGGIVSHHLLSNIDIANFFFEFSDQKVDRVILIGPNHFYPTAYPALTTSYDYETPFGYVKLDNEYIEKMNSEKLIQIDEAVVGTEHAISSLVPYIAHYLPNAKLVPIILTGNAPDEMIRKITNFLKKNNTESTIVIASVDFSHHLYSNAAALHDLRSISAIKSFDIESLSKLEIDSPQSISVLLQYLDAIEARDISLWQQNAANIFNEYDSEDVTSYVFAHARKGDLHTTKGASLLFFGDTMLGRGVGERIRDKTDLFAGIRGPEGNFLKGYDGIVANLEGAITTENCTEVDDELVIDTENLKILSKENISHIGTVNNHFQRCDTEKGLSVLKDSALIPLKGDIVEVIEGTETKIGVLSLYAAPVPSDTSSIIRRVTEAAEMHKNLVVNIHWGVEYSTKPTGAQKELAYAIIDAGADVIIGHHPHVVQSVESYNNGFIVYSLGNFISDQAGELTKEGLATGVFFGTDEKWLFLFPFKQVDGVPTHLSQEKAGTRCQSILVEKTKIAQHDCVLKISE